MGISSAGIGSGLDVNAIVTSLMGVEKQPLTNVTNQISAYQSQISAYGTLKSSLSAFQTTVSALSTASKFNAQAATSSNSSLFTATASGSATIGNYAVTVSQLAQSQKLASAGFANTTDVVGTGTLTISFGTYTAASAGPPAVAESFAANAAKTNLTVTIDSTNNTLAGVRDAINATNASVSATIINNGTSNQLVITSKDTGAVNSLKVSVADSDGNNTDALGLSQLAYDPMAAGVKNLSQLQAAKDALLSIDGIAVTKASNTISDAISGVTLNLLSTSATAANLGVTSDTATIQASVTAFVDGYNKLDTTLRNLTKFDPTGKNSGPLLGDATARTVINQIKSVLTKAIASGGSLTTLSQIGVSFQSTGQLALDQTKLTAAMATNLGNVASLFAPAATATDSQVSYVGSTNNTKAGTYAVSVSSMGPPVSGTINGVAAVGFNTGLVGAIGDASEGLSIKVSGSTTGARGTVNYTIGYAAQLNSLMTSLLSDTGLVTARTDGINSSITRLNQQADSINIRLVAIEARYRAQFTALDTAMASMSTTSSFLTQQLAALNK
ncbi:flagellar hook-associated protein 2 [mine drainage metagenome]|uniref:Filament cap protein n=1 Tax=mine drainage metagenome TaxID=410659 RepID=A0A1J5RNY2_9ZZZZ